VVVYGLAPRTGERAGRVSGNALSRHPRDDCDRGHRTTYLAPFRHIDELAPGDVIQMQMPYADLTYTVVGHSVVSPEDVQAAIARVHYSRLVLSACHASVQRGETGCSCSPASRGSFGWAPPTPGAGRVARVSMYPHRHSRVRSPVHRLSVGGPR